MPLNSGILQQIAAGGQSLAPEMMRKGAQLGQQLKLARQADADRSALQEIAQAFGSGGSDVAIQRAGELGHLGPALQIQQRQIQQQNAERQANQSRSAIGKLRDDLQAGRISQDDFRQGVRALQSRVGGFMSVSPGATVFDRGTGQPVFSAPGKPTKLSPSERKAKRESENKALNLDATIKRLDEATGLVDRAFSGTGAGVRGALGTNLPDALVPDIIAEPGGARATTELGKILSLEAVQAMAQNLTGATTNFELQKFVDILADPAAPPDQKRRTIQRMRDLAANQLALEQERVQELDPQQQGQQPAEPDTFAPSPIEANTQAALREAQEAIAAGADPQAVIQRMEEAGFDTTGLQ